MIPMQYSYVVTYSFLDKNLVYTLDTIWDEKKLTRGDIHQLVRKGNKDFFNSESSFIIHNIAEKTRLSPDYVADQFTNKLKFLFFFTSLFRHHDWSSNLSFDIKITRRFR